MTSEERPSATEAASQDLRLFAVQLRRLTAEVNRTAHVFASSQGLHATDVHALAAILDATTRDGTPMTPGRLREQLNLTSGAVTACLDRLERAGHIARSRDTADRRVVHLHYLPAAREAARSYFEPLSRGTKAARARFSDEELATVLAFLQALNEELAAGR
ncbi:MarR family winged helix-turn-helix transcriptional regulator [Streptomyces marincola]|uniref:MarR family transcriptional regulator n=1 Tax=Streptomyces marincola TaxID=2878388 RepID=A0A1W7CRX0_9ACTN|nr:MarR family transcriptional regulator [Streptomyces marincola]ARQ67538.1 MarR family transcriptional regulator [Streptomyces marincola]